MRRSKLVNTRGAPSADALAAKTGGKVSASLIYRWLAGTVTPSQDNLRRIAEPLGVPYMQLLTEAGYLTPEEAGQDWALPGDFDADPVQAIRDSDKLSERQKAVLIELYESMLPPAEPEAKPRRRRSTG